MGNRTNKLQTLYQIGLNYYQEKDYERAIECWEGAVFFDPENHRAFSYMGLAYCEMGRIDDGIRYFEKSLEIDPEYSKGWNFLGNAYKERGELFRAINAYEKAQAADPEDPSIRYNLAMTCFEVMEYDQAIDLLQKLLVDGEKSDRRDILLCLFNSYYRLERFEEAEQHLEMVFAENPKLAEKPRYRNVKRLLKRFREGTEELPAAP